MASKSNKDYQVRMGIEAFVLGRELLNRPAEDPNRMSVSSFYLLLDELHSLHTDETLSKAMENDETRTALGEKIRKRYEPYLKNIKLAYGFDFSFQSKIFSSFDKNNKVIYSISKTILTDICISFSDESLKLVLSNWKEKASLPGFLVAIRYAIQLGFPIEFQYTKLMVGKTDTRRIYPYLVTLTEGNLGVIGYDFKDKTTKSFLLSRISKPKLDFIADYRMAKMGKFKVPVFDYQKYILNDPSAKFQKKNRVYRVKMAKPNFDLLQHSTDFQFQKLSEENTIVEVEISTHNEWGVFDLLFNYGTYAKLISPPDSLERFTPKLTQLTAHYTSEAGNPSLSPSVSPKKQPQKPSSQRPKK